MASKSSAIRPFKRKKSCESTFRLEIESKDLRAKRSIYSGAFRAVGYVWSFRFYPKGREDECENSSDDSSESPSLAPMVLTYHSCDSDDVTVKYSCKLLSKTGNSVTICQNEIFTFSADDENCSHETFIAINKIKDLDFVAISCDITVLSEPEIVKKYPGGLFEHIEKLWEKGERFDVTFEVEGESIFAHRFMLAARSPVFEAQLFGPLAEAKMECIKIDEIKAEVFRALLHFVYRDELPIDESSDDKTLSVELLQGLIVAADRYALEKLTLLCEEQLAENLSMNTVFTTLVLADRHSCFGLKRKCLKFAFDPGNLPLVAVTKEYLHIMSSFLSLFAEYSDEVKNSPHFA